MGTAKADIDQADVITSRPNRGREAQRPWHIGWAGWKDILKRTYRELEADNLDGLAAAVAFYAILSLFPLLAAAVVTYGLVASPEAAQSHLERVYQYIPPEAATTVADQVHELVVASDTHLSIGLIVSLAVALYSGSRGVNALLIGIQIAYDESSLRPWLRQRALALTLTILALFGGMLALFLLAAVPPLVDLLELGFWGRLASEVVRFILLTTGITSALAILYRYGPKRRPARWYWLVPGALCGTLVWLFASYAFTFYVSMSESYDSAYGAIGGVVVLMVWLYLTGYAILLGAELNAEVEAQTTVDTTVGRSRPAGKREAVKADVIGPVHPDPTSFGRHRRKRWRFRAS